MNVGSHIGQYRIVRKLGAGGMGAVYLGEHILLGRRAAIKTLLPALSMQKEIVERFFNEARATSAISDPGVVQVFDFGYHVDGTAYIVMELLEGESLAARIDRLQRIPARDALRIARQVAGALAAAHERGIVHRDLKPENVFLIRDAEAHAGERAKILDFGICQLDAQGNPAITRSGTTLGTPVYMSPEQCRGSGRVDHRSDIYALGAVLFHMLVGTTPFTGEGSGDFIVAHLQQEPPAPSQVAGDLPPEVDTIVLRCLAKAPDDRFASMAELQHAIEIVLAQLGAAEPEPVFLTPSMRLGAGFRSAYDANIGSLIRTKDSDSNPQAPRLATPAKDNWFVDSSSELTVDDIELPERPDGAAGRRLAFVIAFAAGVVAAVLVSRYAMESDEAVAEPVIAKPAAAWEKPEPAPSVRATLPATEPPPSQPAVRVDPPPAPPRQVPAELPRESAPPPPADEKVQREGVMDPFTSRETVKQDKVARPEPTKAKAKVASKSPRPIAKRRPAPRRQAPIAVKQSTSEDLYDAR